MVTSGADKTIRLWDIKTGRLLRSLNGHKALTSSAKLTADGAKVASSDYDGQIKIWNAESGQMASMLVGTKGDASLLFPRDGRTLFFKDNLQGIGRFDVEANKALSAYRPIPALGTDVFRRIKLSPDERMLAAGDSAGRIYLFDVHTGKQLRRWDVFTGHGLNSLGFSSDGRLLVTASQGQPKLIKVWEVASGKLVRQFQTHTDHLTDVTFSSDGRLIFTSDWDKTVKAWDAASGTLLWSTSLTVGAEALAVAPDGFLAAGGNGIDFLEPLSGRIVRHIGGPAALDYYASASFLPDGNWLLSGAAGLGIWDLNSGQRLQLFGSDVGGNLSPVVIGENGKWIAASISDNAIKLWDVSVGQLLAAIPVAPHAENYALNSVTISPDARLVASANEPSKGQSSTGKTILLWNVSNGSLARTIPAYAHDGHTVAFSPDSQLLASIGRDDNGWTSAVKLWSPSNGQLVRTITDDLSDKVIFSADGRSLATGGDVSHSTIKIYDVATARRLQSFQKSPFAKGIALSPDGQLAVSAGGLNDTTTVWDLKNQTQLFELKGGLGESRSVMFSPDSSRIIKANVNGTVGIWDRRNGELLATTVQSDTGEWITITPEGFFVASEKGGELIHVVRGFEVTGIDQLYQSLYRPDLVRDKLAGDPRGLVREAAAQLDLNKAIASGNAPDVRVTLPGRSLGQGNVDGSDVSAEAEISERGGGIGRVEWRVNGVTSGVDNAAAPATGQPVRLTRSLALNPGDNTIEVLAYNSANLIASVPARVNVVAQLASPSIGPSQPAAPSATPAPAPVAATKPRLFVVVAGVNEYADKRFRLSYAVSDAKEVARGFQDASAGVYQSAEVKLMTDGEVTRERLDAAFAEMAAKTSASDVFVLYLAGHGKTVDGRYYFVPQDFSVDGELNDKAINAALKTKAIAQDQWQRWFASIPARKSVILFDTCDSGTLAGDETQQLERGAANDRLAQATGRSILAASGGSQEALEGYHGHGLFTYELLDAINQADGDRSGTVELNELAAYVYAQVSELSQKVFKQRQIPEMKITTNFPLAKQTRILQDEVTPIAEAEPNYQLTQTAQLQIKPSAGTVVRSLSAKTPVAVLESKNGWSLVAFGGKPLGYVATRDLGPRQ
jgi:WD40 repeat protein/uncharacterized caspase-like protein